MVSATAANVEMIFFYIFELDMETSFYSKYYYNLEFNDADFLKIDNI